MFATVTTTFLYEICELFHTGERLHKVDWIPLIQVFLLSGSIVHLLIHFVRYCWYIGIRRLWHDTEGSVANVVAASVTRRQANPKNRRGKKKPKRKKRH